MLTKKPINDILAAVGGAQASDLATASNALGASVFISDYDSLKDAVLALPVGGGTVFVPPGRFLSGYVTGVSKLTLNNVSIIGAKKPVRSADKAKLENGSVIEGPLPVFADNFSISKIGVDCGSFVCSAYFDGVAQEGFTFGPGASGGSPGKNLRVSGLIATCKASASPVHGILIESVSGVFADGLEGYYGFFAIAIKSTDTNVVNVRAEEGGIASLIIKSDTAPATLTSLNVSNIICTAGTGYGLIVQSSTTSVRSVNLNNISVIGAAPIASILLDNSGQIVADVNISNVYIGGASMLGISTKARRANFSNVVIDGATTGIRHDCEVSQSTCSYENVSISNATTGFVAIKSCSVGTISFDTVVNAWNLSANVRVGSASYNAITTRFVGGPGLVNTWENFEGGGNSSFSVDLKGGGVLLRGLVTGADASANRISFLPVGFVPSETRRFAVRVSGSGGYATAELIVGSDGGVDLVDGPSIASSYVSLDGVFIEF